MPSVGKGQGRSNGAIRWPNIHPVQSRKSVGGCRRTKRTAHFRHLTCVKRKGSPSRSLSFGRKKLSHRLRNRRSGLANNRSIAGEAVVAILASIRTQAVVVSSESWCGARDPASTCFAFAHKFAVSAEGSGGRCVSYGRQVEADASRDDSIHQGTGARGWPGVRGEPTVSEWRTSSQLRTVQRSTTGEAERGNDTRS